MKLLSQPVSQYTNQLLPNTNVVNMMATSIIEKPHLKPTKGHN